MSGTKTIPLLPPAEREGIAARTYAVIFAICSMVCVLIGSYYVYNQILFQDSIAESIMNKIPESRGDEELALLRGFIMTLERFLPLLLIALFALWFMRAAISFMRTSEYSRTGVVPPRDLPIIEDAIKAGKPEAIDQYIRLASLTGGVGLFQKIGLTGLPLTTLGLVVFFAMGVLLTEDGKETFAAFLDFTKLTLGAFIGSFVQRQVERRGQEADIQRAMQTVAHGGGGSAQVAQPPKAP